jgi:tetratricopeptide (TPR) repeat protein
LAECYLETDEPKRALIACQEALKCVKKIGDRKREGVIHRILGNAYLQEGKAGSALTHLEQSVTILRDLQQEFDLGTALYDYAQALTSSGQSAMAREQLSTAMDLFERLGLPREQARVQAALNQHA